jgi:vacuolar-type H+-ATPase subunit C/Vma6
MQQRYRSVTVVLQYRHSTQHAFSILAHDGATEDSPSLATLHLIHSLIEIRVILRIATYHQGLSITHDTPDRA